MTRRAMLRPMPLLMVKAKPNSRVSALTRQDDGTWLAQLKSAPVDGKANAELIGLVARECGISTAMAEDVIGSFALDSAGWCPRTEADLMRYCFHVAGSVGVMMALVGAPVFLQLIWRQRRGLRCG